MRTLFFVLCALTSYDEEDEAEEERRIEEENKAQRQLEEAHKAGLIRED